MLGEKDKNNKSIVFSGQQSLTKYSSVLIRRGLDSISKIEQKDRGIIPYRRRITPENARQVRQVDRLYIGNYVHDVKFSPDGKTLGVASSDGIGLYDTNDFACRLWIEAGYSIGIQFSHDSTTLASVSLLDIKPDIKQGEKLMLMEYPRSHEFPHCCYGNIRSLLNYDEACAILKRYRDEGTIADLVDLVDEYEHKIAIRLWRVFDGLLLNDTEAEYFNFIIPWSIMLVAHVLGSPLIYRTPEDYSSSNVWAIVNDERISIFLRHCDDDSLLYELEGHTADIRCLAFNNDGTILASGAVDGTVRLWGL